MLVFVSAAMNSRWMLMPAAALVLASGCVQQHVSDSVEQQSVIEGQRYANEVRAQSPFETVEISWSEAETLMKDRNLKYRSAWHEYQEAAEQTPLVEELGEQVKDMVDLSLGDILKPDNLLKSMQTPVSELPRQLRSISTLKDLSHKIEQGTWEKTSESFYAEILMRREQVKLHQLLRTGELIDAEMAHLEQAEPLPTGASKELVAVRQEWQQTLHRSRVGWLGEVRDFFNAEYHDVSFKKDRSGLPDYRDMHQPDLTEWQRWCRLSRSQELVSVLQKAHQDSKPALPGTELVTDKLAGIVGLDNPSPAPRVKTSDMRSEVRSLIRSWREMKEAQQRAGQLEARSGDSLTSIAQVRTRQNIFKLRQQEIQSTSVVWMMDENCWN